MNQLSKTTKYKIAKGEFVNIVSAQDIPVRLEKDMLVKHCQASIQRTGEVTVVLAGVRFSVKASQLKPVIKEQPKPVMEKLQSWDFDQDPDFLEERFDPRILSDGRYSSHAIWYGSDCRPSRSGSRVIRGTNSFS